MAVNDGGTCYHQILSSFDLTTGAFSDLRIGEGGRLSDDGSARSALDDPDTPRALRGEVEGINTAACAVTAMTA